MEGTKSMPEECDSVIKRAHVSISLMKGTKSMLEEKECREWCGSTNSAGERNIVRWHGHQWQLDHTNEMVLRCGRWRTDATANCTVVQHCRVQYGICIQPAYLTAPLTPSFQHRVSRRCEGAASRQASNLLLLPRPTRR